MEMKIIECTRDAMQGIRNFIPTAQKIAYVESLLNVGFDTIDLGSFVSPKSIPQMQDTAAVLDAIALKERASKFLVIVANARGAQEAVQHACVDYLGYPFSISENFQMRNTHKTIAESLQVLKNIIDIASSHNKAVVVYLSMGFGNPYGDPWSVEIVNHWVEVLANMGAKIISLSDTTGDGTPEHIGLIFKELTLKYQNTEFGVHLHTTAHSWHPKIEAAYMAGCRRFDGAIMGFGGCPMAKDTLTGNIPTEKIITYLRSQNEELPLKMTSFEGAYNNAMTLFKRYS